MSTLKAGKIQAGISVTPGNNFVLDASADDGTLVLRDSAGTALLTLASGGAADILGKTNSVKVAGSLIDIGATPIIERGSNANGEYVKFADGTLICLGSTADLTLNTLATTPLYVSALTNATFAIPFTSAPTVIASGLNGGTATWPIVEGFSLSAVTLKACGLPNGSTIQILYIAIGRWF